MATALDLRRAEEELIIGIAQDLPKDRATLARIYAEAGKQLQTKKYPSGESRRDVLLRRKAVLFLEPDLRFDEATGKLRPEYLQTYALVLDTGGRLVCFRDQGTAPTVFVYPNIKSGIRSANEQLALLRTQGLITDDTLIAKVSSLTSAAEYFSAENFRSVHLDARKTQ